MRSFGQLLVVATASITAALAQFNDGYENVTTATTPVQIRLAYQGTTAMMVSWNTFSQLTNPTISYGISPDALTQTASSSVSVTYATSLTYNNHVNITGLLPYTTYYYLPQYSNATTPYTFTTARLAGDPTPYTVGVVVDMGTFGALGLSDVVGSGAANPLGVNEQTTIAALTEMIDNYEFMVHAGDIAYADYWLKEEIQGYLPNTTTDQGAVVYEAILNAFFDELINITSQKAYMVNAGNHEANCDNGGTTDKNSGKKYTESICLAGQTNFTGYINHWRMPSGPSGGLGNFWYSYDYGMAHFVHIDTETDLGNGLVGPDEGSPEYGGPFGSYNQQIDWLTNDLASVNRTLTPWVVAFGHRGWYLSASASSVRTNCQTAFESLFHTYDVDLYINGHAHLYERTAPIYNGVIDPNGLNNPNATLYITNGAAGHYDGLDTFSTIQPYSVYREASDYAWSTISFLNSTSMTISTMWSANNTVFDTATLYKNHNYSLNSSSATTSSSSSTSTSSAISSTSTTPTTTTNTATTTSTAIYPTYTNFNGQGHLYVYSGGIVEGDIGSAGTWYNTPGQNVATYTAVPIYSNGTAFLLQHSTNYCTIGRDYSFGCAATASSAATIFGQTADGNLTYNGSPAFYASSAASASARPTIYATPLAVSLNIVWGGTATSSSATTTGTSPSTSSTTVSTSTSGTFISTISSTSFNTASANSSTTVSATSSASPFSTTATVTVTQSITATITQSASTLTVTATQVSPTTVTQTTIQVDATTTNQTSTETDSITITQTTTATEIDVTATTQTSTETDSITITQTTTATEIDISATTQTSTETDLITITQTTVATEIDPTTITQTSTETDSVTVIQTATATETDSTAVVQTTTETDSLTVTQSTTMTETDPTTTTQPASTITTTQSASTVTITQPASTVTLTQPVSTVTTTQPASTVTSTISGSTTTITKLASTATSTKPASTVTITKPASTVTSTKPASTVTTTKSVTVLSTVTATKTVTTTKPASTVTVTARRTKTVAITAT